MYLDEFTGGNTYSETSSFDHSVFSEMKKNKNKQASFTRDISRVPPVLCVAISFNQQVELPLHNLRKLRRQNTLRQAPAHGFYRILFPVCKWETHSLPGFSSSPGHWLSRSWVKGGLEGEFLEEEEVSQFIHRSFDDKNDSEREEFTFDRAVISDRERGKKKWSLFVRAARQTWARYR